MPIAFARAPRSVKTLVMMESVDECARSRGQRREPVAHGVHAEADEQRLAPAEAIAQRARGEHERGEGQRVRIHDPLELARTGVELLDEGRQGDVDERDVDVDREGTEAQRGEDDAPTGEDDGHR